MNAKELIESGYLECNEGWYPLIIETHAKLMHLAPDYIIEQIKEKFGTLRYYWSVPEDSKYSDLTLSIMSDVVRCAEASSKYICEICGDIGHRGVKNHYIKTVCRMCAAKNEYVVESFDKIINFG